LKASIGYILPPLVDAYKKLAPLFAGFQVGSETVSLSDIREAAESSLHPFTRSEIRKRRAELESWTRKGIEIDWSTVEQQSEVAAPSSPIQGQVSLTPEQRERPDRPQAP
jgi:hypothetical protein